MSQAGYTPIQLYYSTTAAAAPSAGNLANGELAVNITDGKLFYKDNGGVVRVLATAAGSAGDVVGPGSSTDNALVRFDGTTGKLVQSSVGVLSDAGVLTGLTGLTSSGSITFSGLTSGRVTYAGTGGLLQHSANLTFDGTTLTANALTVSNAVTLSGGVANGVAYLNGSKVLTTGSALTFDGTNLSVGTTALSGGKFSTLADLTVANGLVVRDSATTYANNDNYILLQNSTGATAGGLTHPATTSLGIWGVADIQFFLTNGATEQMRLTSTGLGIGTSSPGAKLHVAGAMLSSGALSALSASNIFVDQPLSTLSRIGVVGPNTSTFGTLRVSQYSSDGSLGRDSLTLDSSGNLGLGVTPSAWNSAIKALQIGAGVSLESRTSNYGYMALSANQYINSSGTLIYLATDAATKYEQANGVHRWSIAPSGTAGNAISFTQAMTLDASGNLLVNTTGSTYSYQAKNFVVADASTAGITVTNLSQILTLTAGYGGTYVGAKSNHPLIFTTNDTERARIDASGNLLVGASSIPSAGIISAQGSTPNGNFVSNNTAGSGTRYHCVFYENGTERGSIVTNGSSTSYNTSSDYRLKKDVQPLTGALAKVAALKPCTYKWKTDDSAGEGFIAHELQAIIPAAVTGEKDAVDADGKPVYQGIDVSFLVGTLTAAIQEQQAIIQSLTARVAALESN
jgi:hypothetical protein